MVYINAGHNPPFLFKDDGEKENLDVGTTVLGVFDPLPFISEGFIPDLSGFTLFSYTDGVTETENEAGDEIGSDRIEELVNEIHKKKLTLIHEQLLTELDEFRGSIAYKDDITMLSCRVEPK